MLQVVSLEFERIALVLTFGTPDGTIHVELRNASNQPLAAFEIGEDATLDAMLGLVGILTQRAIARGEL